MRFKTVEFTGNSTLQLMSWVTVLSYRAIMGDTPNYTNVEPVIQISDVKM